MIVERTVRPAILGRISAFTGRVVVRAPPFPVGTFGDPSSLPRLRLGVDDGDIGAERLGVRGLNSWLTGRQRRRLTDNRALAVLGIKSPDTDRLR